MDKVAKIILFVLFGISVVVGAMYLFGGEEPDQIYVTPIYTSFLLNWAYILLGLACIAAVILWVVSVISDPKKLLKILPFLAIFAVVILFAYIMADGTPLKIIGYSGTDNVPSVLIFTDTLIYMTYFLLAGVILSIAVTEIIRKFR